MRNKSHACFCHLSEHYFSRLYCGEKTRQMGRKLHCQRPKWTNFYSVSTKIVLTLQLIWRKNDLSSLEKILHFTATSSTLSVESKVNQERKWPMLCLKIAKECFSKNGNKAPKSFIICFLTLFSFLLSKMLELIHELSQWKVKCCLQCSCSCAAVAYAWKV